MANNRVSRVREQLERRGADALIIASDVNRRYVSGFTGTAGYVVVTGSGSYLLTDFRYMTQAPQQAEGFKVVEHAPDFMETARELLAADGVKRLGFEQDHVTFADYTGWKEKLEGIELVPLGGVVEELRMVKDADELAVMKEAAAIADAAFAHILGFLKPGLKETDVALELEFFMRKNGAQSTSFDTIVASGERSALPHGVASGRVIAADEFVKLDYGAYYNGYCSDITRTVVVGYPTDKHREIYKIVLEAQQHALANIRPGMTGREADALTRDIITRYGYGGFFGHGTGHGLGMEIHEAPRLSLRSDTVLIPGMTVTVEPGIYLPGFGGVRIEDDVVITEDGISIITSSPKELIVLG